MPTPNSSVSRTANIRVDASALSKALTRVQLDNPCNPVKVLFTNDGISIWTHDQAKTMNVFLTESKIDDLKVKTDCVLLINPQDFANLLSTKFGGDKVLINTKANAPIIVKNKAGASVTYHPADEDDCAMVPDRWVLPKDKSGWIQIPQKNNEVCTSRITVSRAVLEQGSTDMKVANAPYVVFAFDPSDSTCQSGHWGSKTNQALTKVEAQVEGESVEIGFTNILDKALKITEGESFVLHKHKDVPFTVIENGDMTIIAAETRKEA